MINMSIEFAHKMSLAYSATCKTLCRELKLPQTAFDILMFLANNPDYKTASDIVEVRKIKANLVSVNVEKLVRDGYLERKAVEGDRRKVELICTKKAEPVIRSVCAGSGMERGSRSDTDVLHGSIVRSTCNQKKCTYPYDGI